MWRDAYSALLVQEVQDAQLGLDQVYARLVVVEVYQGPGDLLLHVLLLLELEHVLREQQENTETTTSIHGIVTARTIISLLNSTIRLYFINPRQEMWILQQKVQESLRIKKIHQRHTENMSI